MALFKWLFGEEKPTMKNVIIVDTEEGILVVMKKAFVDAKLQEIDPNCFHDQREKMAKIALFASTFTELTQESKLLHLQAVRAGNEIVWESKSGNEVFKSRQSADWDVPCYSVALNPRMGCS
jgi:hypothetical protein